MNISTNNFTIPDNITLNFYAGFKLNIVGFGSLKIYGSINANAHQIFEDTNNQGVEIYKGEVLPEWFGVCTYQVENLNNPPLYNDNVVIQKAINACTKYGTVSILGKNYRINTPIIINKIGLRIKGNNVEYFPAEGPSNHLTSN